MLIHFFILVISIVLSVKGSLTPDTFLKNEDKTRLKSLFKLDPPYSNLSSASLYYSVVGNHVLTDGRLESVFNSQHTSQLCNQLKDTLTTKNNHELENLYFVVGAANLLGCQVKPDSSVVSHLENFQKQDASVTELYRSSIALIKLGRTLDSAKISKLLQASFRKESESLLSVGLALQLASNLKGPENFNPFYEKIADIIVQADEVDEKFLQFEGGLGVTSGIILGIYSLAVVAGKPTGLSNDQVLKFTNYFLNRKTVQTIKGGADLLQILSLLSRNNFHIPLCVSRYGNPALNTNNPIATVKVSNVLGQSLDNGLVVNAESTMWTGKKLMKGVQGDSTLYALDIISLKPKSGHYNLIISVTPNKADARIVGNSGAMVPVIVQSAVEVENPEIGVYDKDQTSSLKMITLTYPKGHQTLLEADNQQKILMKFGLKDTISKNFLTAHQVFVKFVANQTNQEILYVAELDSTANKFYKFDLNLAQRAKDFPGPDTYFMSLIVGDPVIANSFTWEVATVKLNIPDQVKSKIEKASWATAHYRPKSEIQHIFRPQEKRPPVVVSDSFAFLSLIPLAVLFFLWAKIGVNLSNFSFNLSAIIFHMSLLSIFVLFILFWLRLNMFTTIKCLLGVGLITFLSGHRLLRTLASKRPEGR